MSVLEMIEKEHMRVDIPEFRPGDTVKVHVKIREGGKERIQVFEGVVIRKRKGNSTATFTVRKVSYGVGVERTFPLHSPMIEYIEVVQRGKVRQSRIYYIRQRKGKAARIRERRV
jgi:large subunit ribosomal protein L19